jgi:excisionase family DNA binding protein
LLTLHIAATYNPTVQDETYTLIGATTRGCVEQLSDLKGVIVESESRDYQEVMDNALQLVYSHHHRLVSQLYPESFRSVSLDQLRSGPLGQDLLRLARLARGQIREPKELVLEAIDSVLQLLFWPAAAEDYSVPRAFWDTDLGRMLALAKYRAYDQSELVSIGNAAQQLGVTRPTIYRWMDDRSLSYVRDDMSGRTFVVRRDIDNLKRVASEF